MPHFSGRWGECHAFVGAMKIARTLPVSDRHDEWHPPFVGAMKIARNVGVSGRYIEWYSPFPAPSLRELSSERETEGVSSDGCSGPMIYTPAHINSEIFERLRSSKYTPSVSHSLDSSLREGAGNGCVPFDWVLAKPEGCGRFSSPREEE